MRKFVLVCAMVGLLSACGNTSDSGASEATLQSVGGKRSIVFRVQNSVPTFIPQTLEVSQTAKNSLPNCGTWSRFYGLPNFSGHVWNIDVPLSLVGGYAEGVLNPDAHRNTYCGAPLIGQSFWISGKDTQSTAVVTLSFSKSGLGKKFVYNRERDVYTMNLKCVLSQNEAYKNKRTYQYGNINRIVVNCEDHFFVDLPKGKTEFYIDVQ